MMTESNLARLARAEIAQRGVKASIACYFLTLLTVGLSLLLQSYFIFGLSLLITVIIFWQTRISQKVYNDPLINKDWNKLRFIHTLLCSVVSVALITAALKANDQLHLVAVMTVLAGFGGHFLLVTSLDRTLAIPVLLILQLPLIVLSIINYFSQSTVANLYLLVLLVCCIIYSFIQFRFLNGQLTNNLKTVLQFEKVNTELRQLDQKQEFFIQLVLTLLNNKEPLEKVFLTIIGFLENQNRGWVCSILFLDKNKIRFNQGYAPSIADFYNQAIAHLDIGPTAGSCGTAAYLGQRVIVEDIQTNPLWIPYRQLAAAANLAACWSQPIKDRNNAVIGTFAIYHRVPNAPNEKDIRLIEQAAELVSIVLQHFEAELMVQKTQEQLNLIYNSSIDSMWLIDVEGGEKFRFSSVNDAFTQATGFQREQVINKLIEEVLPPQILGTTRARYLEVISTGKVNDYIDVAVFPTGTKAGLVRLKPIFDENGVCIKILGIVQDVTEKQEMTTLLSQRETDLMYAQKVARLGTWKWDLVDSKNNYTSNEIGRMLDADNDSMLRVASIADVDMFTEESWKAAKPIIENAITTGLPYEVDLERKMKSGEHRWFTARGEVVERDALGNPVLLAGTMQDITERKILENNLTAALKSRDEFIAIASHELKTPLTTIQLSLYGINKNLESVDTSVAEQIRAKLARAKSQGERLETLIDNLLDVTRMGSGKIHLDFVPNTNLSELTLTVLKKYEEELAKSGSTLKKEIQPEVLGTWDKSRLEQIVTNLLTNAIKYGAGKPIEISLTKENQTAILVVRDHGIGIAKDKQDKIFDRFERAVNETNYQGLGLGLWIAREIVKAHNGSIRVDSIENQGSKFTVELPLSVSVNE